MLRFTLVVGALIDSATRSKVSSCGFIRQAFNVVPRVLAVTDADLAAIPSSPGHVEMRRKSLRSWNNEFFTIGQVDEGSS